MKRIIYTILLLGVAALPYSCQKDDEVYGEKNKGKERPTAELTLNTVSDYHLDFTVTGSENAQQYGYAVFTEIPEDVTVYDVITDNVTDAAQLEVFTYADAPSHDISLVVAPETTYYIFTCAITSTGLLSEAKYEAVTTDPEVRIQTGDYTVSYSAAEGAVNPMTGQSFDFSLAGLQYPDGSVAYVIMANWFNIAPAGYTVDPMLVGTADPVTRTITFDGTFGGFTETGGFSIYQGQNAFGMGFMYYDQAQTQLLAFWSGGDSGTDPIIVGYDENGFLTTISYCDFTIHDAATGMGLAVFDSLNNGAFTYIPAEEGVTSALSVESSLKTYPSAVPSGTVCTK